MSKIEARFLEQQWTFERRSLFQRKSWQWYRFFQKRKKCKVSILLGMRILPRGRAHAAMVISFWMECRSSTSTFVLDLDRQALSRGCWSTINPRSKPNERASTTEWWQRVHELRVARRASATTEDARSPAIRKADSCQLARTPPFSLSNPFVLSLN